MFLRSLSFLIWEMWWIMSYWCVIYLLVGKWSCQFVMFLFGVIKLKSWSLCVNTFERSMILGAKNIWNCIMNLEKTGRDFIGRRATLKSSLMIMQIMSLLKMMMKISPHTGLPPSFFFSCPVSLRLFIVFILGKWYVC